jgi:CubicO group peptidase (beta-lactamase class C family)
MVRRRNELDDETTRRLESYLTDWMREHDVPGTSVAVVDGDDLVYAEGFGARDAESNAPATPETLYGIGSCTKSFTAVSILQLVEDGALSLSDPVSDHVPRLGEAPGDAVTVEELLTHASGIPSDGYASLLIPRLAGTDLTGPPLAGDADYDRHVARGAEERVTDRETFFYYNSGYTVLGEVVEAVDGRRFERYVREEVLGPLGMSRSTFSREAFEDADDAMTPHYPDEDGPTAADFPFDERIYAAGGLLSSVTELSRYLRAHLGGGTFDDATVLPADRAASMYEPRAVRQRTADGTEQGYGYGLMTQPFLGDTLVGHGGSIGVSTAWLGFLREAGVGAVVLTNTAPQHHPMDVGAGVLAIVQGEAPAETVPREKLAAKHEAVVGEYETATGTMSATVERDGGALTLTLGEGGMAQEYPLVPETLDRDDHRYRSTGPDGWEVPVRFDVADGDPDLYVTRWRLHRVE